MKENETLNSELKNYKEMYINEKKKADEYMKELDRMKSKTSRSNVNSNDDIDILIEKLIKEI